MKMRISSLYRYPVKGLSPEPLNATRLEAGKYFPGDRLFAIENGPCGFDSAHPKHQSKLKFLVLMRLEALARLRTRYEDASGELIIGEGDVERLRADLATPQGRETIANFMKDFLGEDLNDEPGLLTAPDGFRFTDSPSGYVSIINLASVASIEGMVGAPVDPLRFRGNIHVDGIPAWSEFDLLGRELRAASGLRLKVTSRIVRCAATNVDPQTGLRDLSIPKALMQHLGHMDCGIYAEITQSGSIAPGERLEIVEERSREALPFG
jgi:uncharacterized protein YcbX